MDLVFKVFPDARVVQSHRDPVETIPSLASLIAGVWVIYSDTADPTEVGRQWARKFARGMEHTMAVREARGEDAFLDSSRMVCPTEISTNLYINYTDIYTLHTL